MNWKVSILIFILAVSVYVAFIPAKSTIQNPILAGFYPDPGVCRAGNDYYLVNSSFAYFPGVPIFHSKDLVTWDQIGHVLNRPSQLQLDGLKTSEGIFAPSIHHHEGTFYVVTTLVGGKGNFIVTAKNPGGPWSDPLWLPEIEGIDPSLFFEDGKLFLVHNGPPPNNEALYDGHRTIRMVELDTATFQVKGESHILVNGGVDISREPVWIEGPHIIKKNHYYYLIAAEGGTAENHSQVVFRSKSIYGHYKAYKYNPILTQRHLDINRTNPVTNTGHADIIEGPDGQWWSVFLGCRPYSENHFNTGRETFMLPVQWTEDDWPIIISKDKAVPYVLFTKAVMPRLKVRYPFTGNFTLYDHFDDSLLPPYWVYLRTPDTGNYKLKNSRLSIKLIASSLCSLEHPVALFRRQQHQKFLVEVGMNFSPERDSEFAGLALYQNRHHHILFGLTQDDGKTFLIVRQSNPMASELYFTLSKIPMAEDSDLQLGIECNAKTYNFYYKVNGNNHVLAYEDLDARFLSTETAGGFVGTMIGLYATSSGKISDNVAHFKGFTYQGNDSIFRNSNTNLHN